MYKVLFAFFILLSSYVCSAQNYQCLQAGVKRYYTNSNGYLRGMRIDSVKTVSSSTIYYPFHTPRGRYTDMAIPLLDADGGSWLGKKVLQQNDGTFIFDSYWNDSVIIKTQANVGESWVFYNDSTSLYYLATVFATDTMTILSVTDSIKKIMISAYNGSGVLTSDSLNGFVILLSKNHGFAQVFDLYTFPYHEPDSVYKVGLDFFLDRSTMQPLSIYQYPRFPTGPNQDVSIFKLVDFINPTDGDLYNWEVGDVFQSKYQYGGVWPGVATDYISDTIVSKVVSGHLISYSIEGTSSSCPWSSPCNLISKKRTFSCYDDVYSIIQPGEMPEEYFSYRNYVFYYPDNNDNCSNTPYYLVLPRHYFPFGLGGFLKWTKYKSGIGKTATYYVDGEPTTDINTLLYYNIRGIGCGTAFPSGINTMQMATPIDLYPNPANDLLNIATNGTRPFTATILNVLGQVMTTKSCSIQKEQINISMLPDGLYYVSINYESGSSYREKVVIQH